MYAEHVPIINGAMRSSCTIFKRGIMFALLSARTQFSRMPAQIADLELLGADSKTLWGFKYDAYQYIEEHAADIWPKITSETNTVRALSQITQIPGLGIIKGAFVLQMLGHDIACIDVRNAARENQSLRKWTAHHKSKRSRYLALIREYIEETQGRAEVLWNLWCKEAGDDYGLTAEQISLMHVTGIVPSSWHGKPVAPTCYSPPPAIPF